MQNKKDKTIKLNKYVDIDIDSFIEKEEVNKIKVLVEETKCKQKIKKINTYIKFGILTISTGIIYLSTSLDDKDTAKSLTIIGGVLNTIVMSSDKLNDIINIKLKSYLKS